MRILLILVLTLLWMTLWMTACDSAGSDQDANEEPARTSFRVLIDDAPWEADSEVVVVAVPPVNDMRFATLSPAIGDISSEEFQQMIVNISDLREGTFSTASVSISFTHSTPTSVSLYESTALQLTIEAITASSVSGTFTAKLVNTVDEGDVLVLSRGEFTAALVESSILTH